MGTISNSISLPGWAQKQADRAKKADREQSLGKAPSDPDVEVAKPQSERSTLLIGSLRDSFISIRNQDEDPRFDQALGEPGRVVTDSEEFHFEGTSLHGRLESRGKSRISRFSFEGPQVSYEHLLSDGNFQTGRLDLAAPKNGFQLSTIPFDEPSIKVDPSPYTQATGIAADVLESIPSDRPEAVFRRVFLDGTESMTEVRQTFIDELKREISELDLPDETRAELTALMAEPNASTPSSLYHRLKALSLADRDDKSLSKVREQAGFWQAMEDFPKLQADGLSRTAEYYISPQALNAFTAAQEWDFDQETGLPIADTVVVGGGPGGLASAYHLSERGTRTVLFEAGKVGQGFSDAGAKSVHQLRTNGAASNLIYTANTNQLGVDVSMQRHLGESRIKCEEARDEWHEATREKEHGYSHARADEAQFPANRSELFDHMSQVAHGLAERYPDTFVSENSPVKNIEKVDRGSTQPHLFKVTTETGHEVLCRSLVMATGFVGGDGEHARSLKIFQDLEDTAGSGVTVLNSDHDLFADNDTLDKDCLVFSDRLVGRPEVRSRIKNLPPGARISVIGGGESATKGALEALHLNPEINLDLYTSSPLEAYQTQIPTSVIAPAVTEAGVRHPEVAQKTMDSLREFGTPVTPETLEELFELEAAGRVRIRELGKRYNSETVEVVPKTENGTTKLEVNLKDSEAAQNLVAQRESWIESGLYGETVPTDDPTQLPDAHMVMVAAGYDNRSLRAGPLLQQLEKQELIELDRGRIAYGSDGLTSAKDPMISFNTAGAVAMASDTAIPGRAVRGYRLARNFDEKLPSRERPTDRIESHLPFGDIETDGTEELFNWPKQRVTEFIDDGGIDPEQFERRYEELEKIDDPAERASAKLRLDARRSFPGPNAPLAALMVRAGESPETLTPAEKLLWQRVQRFIR